MGLKRVHQKGVNYFMYFTISCTDETTESKQAVEAVVLTKDNPCTVKVTTANSDLRRWCVKLEKSPEEYLEQLCEAVLSEDNNVGVFEVQEDHLVWKQYFPDKDIYGKKGKFKMGKVEYQDAVEQILTGVMMELNESSQKIHRLTQETDENTRKLDEALELASKSMQMKEDFEREIYSKCAALINAKKLRIHQLRSTHPSSSAAGRSSCLVRTNDDVGTGSPLVKRSRKQEVAADDSDGYSSDTDVDDPDEEMDTDEERAIALSTAKPSRERGMTSNTKQEGQDQDQDSSKTKKSIMPDSQELFNASLEAELFPSSATVTQRGANSTVVSTSKPKVQSPPQLTRSKAAEPVPSPSPNIQSSPSPQLTTNKGAEPVPSPSSESATSKGKYDDDTQMSILSMLF